jgi:peptide/nickel transport system ATP-binding protein
MSAPASNGREVLLDVRDLKMHFPIHRGFLSRVVGHVRAVDGVSFAVRRGETLSLVGESGCGKTTLGRCIVRIYDPMAGEVLYTSASGRTVDIARLQTGELAPYRLELRMIFQDPHSSLNPRMTVRDIVGESLLVNGLARGSELDDRIVELLKRVGLRPEYLRRYPHAFSGGERQRIGIARALSVNPRLIVADEAVSALDVSVQAQILNLLKDLQAELGLTYLFVAHNLSVVQYVSDHVAVMYVGKIVELAERKELYQNPKHPYTEALMSAVPRPDPRSRAAGARIRLEGEVADPAAPPSGCYFHPRCRYATSECAAREPALRDVGGGHIVACHRAHELSLKGIG